MTITEASKTPTVEQAKQQRVSPVTWFLGIALILALAAMVWLFIERDQTGTGPVSTEIATMLEERVSAINEGDAETAASFYAEDATITNEIVGSELVGRDAISGELKYLVSANVEMEPMGAPFQITEGFVAQVHSVTYGFGLPESEFVADGEFILVHEIDANGMIAHEYMIGWLD